MAVRRYLGRYNYDALVELIEEHLAVEKSANDCSYYGGDGVLGDTYIIALLKAKRFDKYLFGDGGNNGFIWTRDKKENGALISTILFIFQTRSKRYCTEGRLEDCTYRQIDRTHTLLFRP